MPSKKQTRRAISVKGVTYAAVFAECQARQISVSDYVEQLIAADRQARGLPAIVAPDRCVAAAVAAVQREGAREVEQAAEAVRAVPLPAESKIVAGPPPEQTAFFGRVETPPAPLRAVPVNVPPADRVKGTDPAPHLSLWRSQAHAHARAAIARRDAPVKPVAIRSGFEETASGGQAIARPAHGDKLPPPDPSRSARNVVIF